MLLTNRCGNMELMFWSQRPTKLMKLVKPLVVLVLAEATACLLPIKQNVNYVVLGFVLNYGANQGLCSGKWVVKMRVGILPYELRYAANLAQVPLSSLDWPNQNALKEGVVADLDPSDQWFAMDINRKRALNLSQLKPRIVDAVYTHGS